MVEFTHRISSFQSTSIILKSYNSIVDLFVSSDSILPTVENLVFKIYLGFGIILYQFMKKNQRVEQHLT